MIITRDEIKLTIISQLVLVVIASIVALFFGAPLEIIGIFLFFVFLAGVPYFASCRKGKLLRAEAKRYDILIELTKRFISKNLVEYKKNNQVNWKEVFSQKEVHSDKELEEMRQLYKNLYNKEKKELNTIIDEFVLVVI